MNQALEQLRAAVSADQLTGHNITVAQEVIDYYDQNHTLTDRHFKWANLLLQRVAPAVVS